MRFASLFSYQIILILLIFKINNIHSTGEIYTTENNKQYYIESEQKYTWFDALSECLKVNMSLVSIETSKKSEEINTLVLGSFGKTYLWVGGVASHYPNSNKQLWITTGQQLNFTFWYDGYPHFKNDEEYCIQIGFDSMKWATYKCVDKVGFICEEHPLTTIKNIEIQEMKKKLQEFQQKLQDHEQLQEDFQKETKERQNLQQQLKAQKELEQQLKEDLQQIKENNLKECKENLKMEIKSEHSLWENWLKPQQQLGKQLQMQTQKEIQKKVDDVVQSNEEEYKKYRNLYFQFHQNTYFQPNAQHTFNEFH